MIDRTTLADELAVAMLPAFLRAYFKDADHSEAEHHRSVLRAILKTSIPTLHTEPAKPVDREKVAKAISNADLDFPDPEEYWHHLADAAIAAMTTD